MQSESKIDQNTAKPFRKRLFGLCSYCSYCEVKRERGERKNLLRCFFVVR
jgi:hypothetical protein